MKNGILKIKATATFDTLVEEASLELNNFSVERAYFAKQKIVKIYETVKGKQSTYIVKSGDNLGKIAKANNTTVPEIKKLNGLKNNNINPKQKLNIKAADTKKEKGENLIFTPVYNGSVGDELYLVTETVNLNGKNIKIKVHQGNQKVLADVDKALTFFHNNKDTFEFTTKIGEFADGTYLNDEELKEFGAVKLTLAPKDADKTKWEKAINKQADKKTQFYLYVEVDSQDKIRYCGNNTDKNQFLNDPADWFNLEYEKYKTCPINPKYRSHFVIHCTAGNMTKQSIASKTTYYSKKVKKTKRSGGHIYVMKDGSKVVVWPLIEKNVWATKVETKMGIKGEMFHIELNYGPPDKPSQAQYETLADLYIEASNIEKCWPIIVPHIEVDRGYADGHQDPTDFDYNHFYSILKNKGLPIEDIKKFDHNRYWGHKSYKVPWGTDKKNWPPLLKGNPHK